MMKDASDSEIFEGKEKDQFVWFAKAKKELSCMQGTEFQQEEETEMIKRLDSTKKQQKSGYVISTLQKPEFRSEERTKCVVL